MKVVHDNFIEQHLAPGESRINYILVDTKDLRFEEDRNRLKAAVEVVSLLNALVMVEKIYDKLESPFTLDRDMLDNLIDALLTCRDFTKHEQEQYCRFKREYEEVVIIMEHFTELGDYRLPPEIDIAVFGISIDEQVPLEDELDPVLSTANSLSIKMAHSRITIEEYMETMEDLLLDHQLKNSKKELV